MIHHATLCRAYPMSIRRIVSLLALVSAPLGAQTVFTGFTQNTGCVVGGPNGCAVKMAPSGAALTARNQFFANLNNSVATQNFDNITGGTSAPLTLGFGFAGNATLSGSGNVEIESSSIIPFGRYAISGDRYFQTEAAGTATFSILFSQKVAGFGFYGVDFGDVGGSVLVRLLSGGSLVSTLTIQPSAGTGFIPQLNGGLRYWGVLFGSNAFDKVEFSFTGDPNDSDVFAFDDLTVADASQVQPPGVVPEPSTYLLMATGLGALALVARRRRAV